jgi:hypothetical protein
MLTDLCKRLIDAQEIADAAGAADVGISLDRALVKLKEEVLLRHKGKPALVASSDEPSTLH